MASENKSDSESENLSFMGVCTKVPLPMSAHHHQRLADSISLIVCGTMEGGWLDKNNAEH